jgi:hypothetical protein
VKKVLAVMSDGTTKVCAVGDLTTQEMQMATFVIEGSDMTVLKSRNADPDPLNAMLHSRP